MIENDIHTENIQNTQIYPKRPKWMEEGAIGNCRLYVIREIVKLSHSWIRCSFNRCDVSLLSFVASIGALCDQIFNLKGLISRRRKYV